MKSSLKLYLINVIHLFFICFIYEIFFTFVFNTAYFVETSEVSFIWFWVFFIFFLIYKTCKIIKSDFQKSFLYFITLFVPLALLNSYFNIFNLIEPRYFGADYFVLYDYFPTKSKSDISEFFFWQTGVSSGFISEHNDSNLLVTFFTVPPVALLECLTKSIFPKLYVVLLLQLPYIISTKKIINWRKKMKEY